MFNYGMTSTLFTLQNIYTKIISFIYSNANRIFGYLPDMFSYLESSIDLK